jgi:DNA-binding MarR family transcriptional regulator
MGCPVGSLLCVSEPAGEFEALFREVYLTFHRRDAPRTGLTGASRAVLQHLLLAGPLTVGEMGAHLDRAQSVVSDIVTHLERDGLLEREADPADRRRTLVWLTGAGRAALDRENQVLDLPLVAAAIQGMPAEATAVLLDGLRSLLAHAPRSRSTDGTPTPGGTPT